jgi:hypothetical protein
MSAGGALAAARCAGDENGRVGHDLLPFSWAGWGFGSVISPAITVPLPCRLRDAINYCIVTCVKQWNAEETIGDTCVRAVRRLRQAKSSGRSTDDRLDLHHSTFGRLREGLPAVAA